MLIVHAALVNGALAVWGEVPPEAEDAPQPKKGGRPRKGFEIPPPPRCGASAERLRTAFAEANIAIGGEPRTLIGWLPTANGRPAPSSPLVGELVPVDATRIEPWSVDALMLDDAATIDLLASVVGKRLIAPGVIVGADLAFVATAMRFAAALTSRGHVLPSLEQVGKEWFARWIPAPTAGEHEQLGSLVRAVPPVLLAFGTKHDAPPEIDRRAAIAAFAASVVDRLMRQHARIPQRPGSLHDQWLSALGTADGRVDGDALELTALRSTLAEWRRPVAEQALFDFRVAFRLEEPPHDENGDPVAQAAGAERWTIRFLLQGIDDPSLILPLSLVWRSDARGGDAAAVRRLVQRGRGQATRFILGSLAQAATISKAVDEALRKPSPSEIDTDTNGAFTFLAADAGALESAGFGVFLPSWWSGKGTKKRLSLRASVRAPKFKSKSGLSLQELVDVEWKVALGGEVLSLAELRALARMKTPLIRVRGAWVQLNSAEIEEAIRFARTKGQRVPLGDIMRMSLSATASGAEVLALEEVQGEGAVGEILERLQGKREWEELPPPAGFEGSLRPYQARGFSWLDFLTSTGLGACLADDMGLGKTVQTLALIQKRWLERKAPLLLICPTSVTGNWVREAARFTPSLPVLLHHGADRRRGKEFAKNAKKSAIVISSYALLTRDAELLRGVDWKGVVLDEAQNIKNSETKQAKAARAIPADMRIALTGTPVENNIGDLWSIADFLNPGYLGSVSSFREKFFLPIQTRRDPDAIESLRRLTGPLILRRLKTDRSIIADLPEKNEMKVYCTLTKEQASLHEAVVRDAQKEIEESDGIGRKGLILATITKLKQVCNHPRQLLGDRSAIDGRSGKLTRLREMLSEAVESGDRALIFTQFAEMGGILQTHLQEQFGMEALFLHGGTPRGKRDEMVERFQDAAGNGPQIFILSLKAGGTGLNLTRANHVFHFDRWWNPAVENQATDRAFRIGQTRSVQVHKFICGGTFEEKIDAMIEGKLELATKVVGTGEGWLTEMSNRELRDLFALRADAVGE
jgi:superfamily II DNA or RNA helicase